MFQVKDISSLDIKYVGRSRAKVIDNRDPESKGRILVDHPQLGETEWIPYLTSSGIFDVPNIGRTVYIEAETGEHNYPVAHGSRLFSKEEIANIPAIFRRDVPTVKGFYTPNGHSIELDDGVVVAGQTVTDSEYTDTSRGIRLTSKDGNKIHILEDTKKILIEDKNGNKVELDYNTDNITITAIGNVIINCVEAIVTASGDATITAGGKATVEGATIELKSAANVINGGVVTDNVANIDPITGIPLTAVGGVLTV